MAILSVLLASPVPAATPDIDGIYIDSDNRYRDGTPYDYPWEFEISVDFVNTGSLNHIDVTKPGGSIPFTTIYEDDGDWEYESSNYLTLADLQNDYPTGNHTLDFRDSSNALLCSVTLYYPDIDEPLNPVDFTYPSQNGQTGISTTPTFSWTIDPGDGDALDLWLEDLDSPNPDEDVYDNWPVSMTTTSWMPGPLLTNRNYCLGVAVRNVKDIQFINGEPVLPTMTVNDDTFAYSLSMDYLNHIDFTTIPEPATICLLGLGALSLVSRKK